MLHHCTCRAAGAGIKAMALGAEETSQLAKEGVKPTDDDPKYTWTSTVGSKVRWGKKKKGLKALLVLPYPFLSQPFLLLDLELM